MTNSILLCAKMKAFGIDCSLTANELGLTEQAFKQKLSGKSEFKVSEIEKLKTMLNLTNSDIGEIFFQQYSDGVIFDVEMLYEQLPLTVRLELLERVRSFKAIGVKV